MYAYSNGSLFHYNFAKRNRRESIDLLPNDGAATSTGSEVITLKSAKSQKRQTAKKQQRK
jgi:hypothetical protein